MWTPRAEGARPEGPTRRSRPRGTRSARRANTFSRLTWPFLKGRGQPSARGKGEPAATTNQHTRLRAGQARDLLEVDQSSTRPARPRGTKTAHVKELYRRGADRGSCGNVGGFLAPGAPKRKTTGKTRNYPLQEKNTARAPGRTQTTATRGRTGARETAETATGTATGTAKPTRAAP